MNLREIGEKAIKGRRKKARFPHLTILLSSSWILSKTPILLFSRLYFDASVYSWKKNKIQNRNHEPSSSAEPIWESRKEASWYLGGGDRLVQKCTGLDLVSSGSLLRKWLRERIKRSNQDDFDSVGTTLSWTCILSKTRLPGAQLRREALARGLKALSLPSASLALPLPSLMLRQTNPPNLYHFLFSYQSASLPSLALKTMIIVWSSNPDFTIC